MKNISILQLNVNSLTGALILDPIPLEILKSVESYLLELHYVLVQNVLNCRV
jgi:hypothetical protein